jgi:hypothetical protein
MRRQRVYRFVVVLVLIFPAKIFSQQLSPRIAQISPHASRVFCCSPLKTSTDLFNNFLDRNKVFRKKAQANLRLPGTTRSLNAVVTEPCLYSASYVSHLGFFCQKEYQFERSTSIPLRLRLGSLEYVDKMEGKK